jgi:hypothetical protein
MMRGQRHWSIAPIVLGLFLSACGGSKPPAEDPSSVAPAATSETPPASPAPSSDDAAAKPAADSAPPKKDDVPEPTFTPDMTVEEAIKAIPQGTERLNVDQETLSKPLEDGAVFESCKAGSTHFKMRIAVWRGKAVAIDLTTTPKNPKLTECLKGKIRDLNWSAKVPSLNTVEYAM